MIPRSVVCAALVIPLSIGFAQRLNHSLAASQADLLPEPRRATAGTDTVRVLAAMVQFQPDNNKSTTGNGQFVLSAPTDSILDAPPRNRAYFEQHLTFLANYYRKVSRGRLAITFRVVDSVFTLPTDMTAYSPFLAKSDSVVANLARDTWARVDASGRVTDFGAYDCFVVFHAGAGRDVDLVGTLGYDPSPLDIPSLYIGPQALARFYGPSYRGFPVQNGTRFLRHSIVLPETEYRTLPGISGDVPLELAINGLLCASVGNFLGLPDLYNTTDGRSGIGRFGLMDGQAIFSFAGAFPPEPSAWEKYWLGWVTPIDVPPGTSILRLPAHSTPDTVYRVRFSPTEYFLLENRNRDPQRNGQSVTSIYNGVVRTQQFRRDTTGFDAFDVSALAGVVTDVEDLDWSLPGGIGVNNEWYDGGVVIWHIDEAVIRIGLANNTVNADPEHRGVDVEEADGSQDIGQQYGGLFAPGAGSESGTALDFWYQGNPSPVYKNEFTSTTFPNTRSNAGAYSHVSIKSFSPRGPIMNATVVNGDGEVALLPGFPRSTGFINAGGLRKAQMDLQGPAELLLSTTAQETSGVSRTGSVFVIPTSGARSLAGFRTDGLVATTEVGGVGIDGLLAVRDLNGDGYPEILFGYQAAPGAASGRVRAVSVRTPGLDSAGVTLFSAAPSEHQHSPVISDSLAVFPGVKGRLSVYRLNGALIDSIAPPGSGALSPQAWLCRYRGPNTFVVATGSVLRLLRLDPIAAPVQERIRDYGVAIRGTPSAGVFRVNGTEQPGIVFLAEGDLLYLVGEDLAPVTGFPVALKTRAQWPGVALGDIDRDGARDIIVFGQREVLAFNSAGAMLDHYPVVVTDAAVQGTNAPFISTNAVLGDLDGDGAPEIVGGTSDGKIFALTAAGRETPGFPIAAGFQPWGVALFEAPSASGNGTAMGLAAVTSLGVISAWRIGTNTLSGPVGPWPDVGRDGNNSRADFSSLATSPLATEFFPKDRAYNWPNPVYHGSTFIRYFVRDPATVHIRVFDLAGALVKEFSGPGVGGVDNEVAWDVSGVQSGIYFARIEARGSSGSGTALVKIAVVK